MWTLVIITLMAAAPLSGGGVNRSGASTTTTFLDFPDQQKCNAAASTIQTPNGAMPSGIPAAFAVYRIVAKCVER